LAVLPLTRRSAPDPLVDTRGETSSDDLSPIQLLESSEYRYRFHLESPGIITGSRPELFEADDASGHSGRVKTGLAVGVVPLLFHLGETPIVEMHLEVRSRKLNYRSEYRWMLRDIAEGMAEVIMDRFGTSEQSFAIDRESDSRTAYQRFAFLKALLDDEGFSASLQRVVQRPYVSWDVVSEQRSIRRGIANSSRLGRDITRAAASPREIRPHAFAIPAQVVVGRTVESLNNIPNRFVVFALRRWLSEVSVIHESLITNRPSPQAERGLRETADVQTRLEEVLAHSILRDVSDLTQLPTNNTVLLTRAGYRDVYRAFIEFEMAARLGWPGGEAVYGAGQKNVATLYEYWVFLQVAKVLAELAGGTFALSQLLSRDADQMTLILSRGEAKCLRGSIAWGQREMDVQLWFNRQFSTDKEQGSWSKPMRPDCSLLITPSSSFGGAAPIWLHFDAKYRIENIRQILSDDAPSDEPDAPGSQSRREDLLKMHAYRDAIRRSAGAYVIYPGDRDERITEFHELLPGLGAFALRPSESGEPSGAAGLRAFLVDVFAHAASQTTQHERGRYWSHRVFERPQEDGSPTIADFLTQPPADTAVLLGFARSPAHFEWIVQNRLYNLRADDRRGSLSLDSPELGAQFIVIYAREVSRGALFLVDGPPLVLDAEQLRSIGYPDPRGKRYLCLPLSPVDAPRVDLSWDHVSTLARALANGRPVASPIAATWSQLVMRR
jgi:uncharacterized protein